jgi:uncharacterized cupin superfamily protein
MEKVPMAEAPQSISENGPDRLALDEALGATDMAIKYYDLAPGDIFSGGFHTHHTQEEIFVILEGEATWDTEDGEASMTIAEGEAVRFAPGEFHHGYVAEDADQGVRALAMGAPPGMPETVTVFTCPACGTEDAKHDVDFHEESLETICQECGNSIVNEVGGDPQ